MGASADQFHDGWMRSPGHRANILDPVADSVGVAVVEGSVDLYAVEDFAHAVRVLSIEEQEKRVGELLTARGLRLLKIGDDARKSCELDRDYVGNSKAKYIAHYETPDISRFPGNIEKEIQSPATSLRQWAPAPGKGPRGLRASASSCCSIDAEGAQKRRKISGSRKSTIDETSKAVRWPNLATIDLR